MAMVLCITKIAGSDVGKRDNYAYIMDYILMDSGVHHGFYDTSKEISQSHQQE